jgi:hypothetical protein
MLAIYAFLLAALTATASAIVMPQRLDTLVDRFRCALCQDVIKDVSQWTDGDFKAEEQQLVGKCSKVFGGSTTELSRLICDDFAKHGIDELLVWNKQNTPVNGENTRQTCERANFCPARRLSKKTEAVLRGPKHPRNLRY